MVLQQVLIIAIIFGALILFCWGRWRYDIVALLALLAATVVGVIDAKDMFHGFCHPATITVAIVLILSQALMRSGATEFLTKLVMKTIESPTLHVTALTFLVALFSAFMNNVGALALLMPVAVQTAVKAGRSPSVLLMPLSFGSLLGGLTTLIGTPPNIIISAYRQDIVGKPFDMFDFSPVGCVVAFVGLCFISLVGWRLIRQNVTAKPYVEDLFDIEGYITETVIPEGAKSIGKTFSDIFDEIQDLDVIIVGLVRGGRQRSSKTQCDTPVPIVQSP